MGRFVPSEEISRLDGGDPKIAFIERKIMMKTKVILTLSGLGVLLVGGAGFPLHAAGLFEAHELSGDFLGFYGSRDKGGTDTSAWGYGAGINYFVTDKIGMGADTYADAFTVPYLLNGSAIFRYPLEDKKLAPYGFGGFGRQWDHAAQWSFHLGAGLEYRLQEKTGVFLDVREVFPDKTKDYTVVRFGIRFKFR
jgi:hypothetical protein